MKQRQSKKRNKVKVNVGDFSVTAPAAESDDETLIEDTDKRKPNVVVADVANEVRVSFGKSGFYLISNISISRA